MIVAGRPTDATAVEQMGLMRPLSEVGSRSQNRSDSTNRHATAEQSVRAAYAAYSAQRLADLLAFMTSDVDWPDRNGRLRGRDELRSYWTKQWARTRTQDVPTAIAWLEDAVCAVLLDQTVRSLDGEVVSRARLVHLLQLDGLLISRLDIVPLAQSQSQAIPDEKKESHT